jgi:hypothetical protein
MGKELHIIMEPEAIIVSTKTPSYLIVGQFDSIDSHTPYLSDHFTRRRNFSTNKNTQVNHKY